tara:strand:+ start:801 stop:1055 length:255 start_codon:yes stop_codon:yes gene_type:complete
MENKESSGTDLKEYLIPFASIAEKIISDVDIDYKNITLTIELHENQFNDIHREVTLISRNEFQEVEDIFSVTISGIEFNFIKSP